MVTVTRSLSLALISLVVTRTSDLVMDVFKGVKACRDICGSVDLAGKGRIEAQFYNF